MKRYHPFLVTLHWVLAIVIMAWLFMGTTVLDQMPNSDPRKIGTLQTHMLVGVTILVFMLIRLVVRMRSAKLEVLDVNTIKTNKAATIGHYALYVLVILMALSGMATAQLLGFPEVIDSGLALPENFEMVAPLIVHKVFSKVLILLIVGHTLAALYHQFALKEKLFARVWFGNRQ